MIRYGRGMSVRNARVSCEVHQFSGQTSMEGPLRKKISRNRRMILSNIAKTGSDKIAHEGLCEDVNDLSGCVQC